MLVFWRHGYESTSMTTLTTAMGMNAPSVYAAFGDKKSLFLKSLDLYVGDVEALRIFLKKSSSAREAIYELLKASAIRFTGKETPRGCMLASATASCSADSLDVQAVAAKKRSLIEEIIAQRISRDIEIQLLPKSVSGPTLAAFTITVIQGMSVIARDGASRKKLLSIAQTAMNGWT
ncbi:MAG: TetR/AcrR family transcriptional regulator [Cryobacterium sp.]|nr:TetR/AcrR family transcriptional regulator [Oligoflexia bacterium]